MTRTLRQVGGAFSGLTDTGATVILVGATISGNISCATLELYNCRFSTNASITTTGAALFDRASWTNGRTAGISTTGVTTLVPLWDGQQVFFGATTATQNQYYTIGAIIATTFSATQSNAQNWPCLSWLARNLRTRAPSTTSTVMFQKGGADTTLTCTATSGNGADTTHSVTGNATDLIDLKETGTAGGLVRGSFELVTL